MKLLLMRTLKSMKNFRVDDVQAVLYMVLLILLDIMCPLLNQLLVQGEVVLYSVIRNFYLIDL